MQGAWTECLLTLKLGHSGWESSLATAGQGGKCAHCFIRWFRKWLRGGVGVWGCVTCRERCTQLQEQGHMHVHTHTHCRIMVIAYSLTILLLLLRGPLKGLKLPQGHCLYHLKIILEITKNLDHKHHFLLLLFMVFFVPHGFIQIGP